MVMLVAAVGCRSTTGQSTGEWVDDKTITARVKTALAATKIDTLTKVDVDTLQGTVYLTGIVDSEETRRRAVEAARNVSGVKNVESRLQVAGAAPRPTTAVGPPHPVMTEFPKLSRVDREAYGTDTGPFAAYDRSGKRVATVYALPAGQAQRITDLRADHPNIEHVTILPHPGSAGPQYVVVIWHITRDEAARLR
jgi:hypothetical protein